MLIKKQRYAMILVLMMAALSVVAILWMDAQSDDGNPDSVPTDTSTYSDLLALSLDQTKLTLKTGDTALLTATLTEEGEIIWETDAPEVATVDDGTVTALSPGKTVITAVWGEVRVSCVVTVEKNEQAKLSFKENDVIISVEGTTALSYIYIPLENETLLWASSDSNIVSVTQEGVIKGLVEGSAVIAVTAEGVTAKCTVYVMPKAQFVSLSRDELYVKPQGTVKLEANVLPYDAIQKVKWKSSNPTIAMVSESGIITGIMEGYIKITATSADGFALATCHVYVSDVDNQGAYLSDSIMLFTGQGVSLEKMIQLVGTSKPTDVSWKSDDSFVASVNNEGYVKAIGYGMSLITVTHMDTGDSAECVIMVEFDEDAYENVENPPPVIQKIVLDIPYINQRKNYPTGCESVSTSMVLQYFGIPVSVDHFIDKYLDVQAYPSYINGVRRGCNPWVSFPGNPRSSVGYGCYSPAIVNALLKFVDTTHYSITYGYSINTAGQSTYTSIRNATFKDTSHMMVSDLCKTYIDKGIPVIFWGGSVMRYEHIMGTPTPGSSWYINNTDERFTWIAHEHCLVLVGYDASYYYFNDPLQSKQYAYARASVEASFQSVYAQFVAIEPIPQEQSNGEQTNNNG